MPPQNGDFGGRTPSCEGSEELTIDQARILCGPARRLAQGENVKFFVSNQFVRPHIDQFNCLKGRREGGTMG